MIRFLRGRTLTSLRLSFQDQLLAVIQQSKTDPTAATAAANAATILVRAGVRFNGADLRGIRIPGADLSDRMLAVSTAYMVVSVYDTNSWIRAYQHSVDGAEIMCVAFSPNGQQLVYGTDDGIIQL
ncbi:unnamed protein product [Mortierella alpina]